MQYEVGCCATWFSQGGAGCSTSPLNGVGPLTCLHTGAQVWLYGVTGLRTVEIHVAAPGTHGDVVAVLYAAAFANATAVTRGLVAKGFLMGHDFLGPLLLPLAQHLDATFLQTR